MIEEIYKRLLLLRERGKYAFVGALIFGFIAHGYMLANKISFHDDIGQLFGLGSTYGIGRWFLGIIHELLDKSIGVYSMPWLLGSLYLLFIAASAGIAADLLEIESVWGRVFLGGIMSVFPVVADTFLYMFTAAAYFLALLLMVLSVWMIENFKYGFIAGIFLFSCSLGIYQAYLGIWIGIVLCVLLKKCFDAAGTFSKLMLTITKYAGASIMGLILYLIFMKIFMILLNIEPGSYQGFNELGILNVIKIIRGMGRGWLTYFSVIFEDVMGLSNNIVLRVSASLSIAFSCLCFIRGCIKNIKDNKIKCIAVVLFLLFPMGVNIIYAICTMDSSYIYTLMLYPLVLMFVFPIFLRERIGCRKGIGKAILIAILSVTVGYYIYYDNEMYLKISFLQEQTSAYYTVMIGQIKSCPGYEDSMPVAFVGGENIEDQTLTRMEHFDNITLIPAEQTLKNWINNYNFIAYMAYHCGFSPRVISDIAEIGNEDTIASMPCYPDSGSIQIINDVVVVKMGNEIE